MTLPDTNITEPNWDTFYVTVLSGKDLLGRQRFEMAWMANNIGRSGIQVGLRHQMFYTVLSIHIKAAEGEGKKIVFTEDSLSFSHA